MRIPWQFLVVLGLALPLLAEPYFKSVSVSQTVTSTPLPAFTQTVTIVSDGGSTCYFRLFTDVDTAGAATTAHSPVKSGESLEITLLPPAQPTTEHPGGVRDSESVSPAGARARYYRSLSSICATGETATWRVYAK